MPSKRRRAQPAEPEEEAAGPAPPAPVAAPHGVAGEPHNDAADDAAQEDGDMVELDAAADRAALDSLSESSDDSAARSVSTPEAAPGQATPMAVAGDPRLWAWTLQRAGGWVVALLGGRRPQRERRPPAPPEWKGL